VSICAICGQLHMAPRIEIHGPRGQLDRFTVEDDEADSFTDDDLVTMLGEDLRAFCRATLNYKVTEIDPPAASQISNLESVSRQEQLCD